MSSTNEFIFKVARRYPFLVVLTVVMGFSDAVFNGVSTFLVIPLVMAFLGQDMNIEGAPPILQAFTSLFDGVEPEFRVPAITFAVVLALFLKNASQYASSYSAALLKRALVLDIRRQALQILLDVDLDFFAKMRAGDLLNRLGAQVQRAANSVQLIATFIRNILTVSAFVVALLAISWQLTLVFFLLLPLVVATNQYFVRRAKKYGESISSKSREFTSSLHELIAGIRLIKSRKNEPEEYKKIDFLLTEVQNAQFLSNINSSIIGPINNFSGVMMVLAIVLLGEFILGQQIEATSTVLLNFLVFLFRMLPFVGQLNQNRSQLANLSASVDLVSDFLRRDNKPFMTNGHLPLHQLQEGIRFENVSFHYPEREQLVLRDINLFLPKGKTLALVGGSGAGKSTIADLVPRFYDVSSGRILIDGNDTREYDLQSLRESMGIISQDTFLFNDTVRNNIAYADAKATDDEVVQAAKYANAYEFIMDLPQGFDTTLGDRGVLLSGGQRQRIAIARALLQKPQILILDEATSALDTVSERLVQEAIDRLSRDRTVLVIAHRLSTIQKADKIAVLERGKVVEMGTHSELLQKQNGYYRHLYSIQFSDEASKKYEADQQVIAKASYEARNYLNSIVGDLQLLVDELVDTPEEQLQITEDAYHSAISLLRTLEIFENQTKKDDASILNSDRS
jgi:subfamily B ATP-binding cassette protein MsbA